MNLQDIFDQLTAGELSQLSIGGNEEGSALDSGHPSLLRNVQMGLTALYRRFNLKEGTTNLTLVPGQFVYTTTSTDVLKIERVLTAGDLDLPLNDTSDDNSCFTPSALSLKVPSHIVAQGNDLASWLKTPTLTLVYRANHPQLSMTDLQTIGPGGIPIEMPDAYLQALLLYVAWRLHNPQGMTGNFHAGNNFYGNFEAECKRLEAENLQVDQTGQESRIVRGGWV